MVDPPSQVPRAREVPISPCNDHNRELVSAIHEVFLENVALDNRHYPLFALQSCVEFSYEEVIEHCLIVPGLERFHFFFSQAGCLFSTLLLILIIFLHIKA